MDRGFTVGIDDLEKEEGPSEGFKFLSLATTSHRGDIGDHGVMPGSCWKRVAAVAWLVLHIPGGIERSPSGILVGG